MAYREPGICVYMYIYICICINCMFDILMVCIYIYSNKYASARNQISCLNKYMPISKSTYAVQEEIFMCLLCCVVCVHAIFVFLGEKEKKRKKFIKPKVFREIIMRMLKKKKEKGKEERKKRLDITFYTGWVGV